MPLHHATHSHMHRMSCTCTQLGRVKYSNHINTLGAGDLLHTYLCLQCLCYKWPHKIHVHTYMYINSYVLQGIDIYMYNNSKRCCMYNFAFVTI